MPASSTSTADGEGDPAKPNGHKRPRRRWVRRVVVLFVVMLIGVPVGIVGTQRWRAIKAGSATPVDWQSWALLRRGTGQITGSANFTEPTTSESMIKAWIAADDLRRLTERHQKPTTEEGAALSAMIRDSDDRAAQVMYERNGGDDVVKRMISICGLTDTTVHHDWWSLTNLPARDAVRMGQCVADGRAAGPQWTQWVLDAMRSVIPEDRFGIPAGLSPAQTTRLAIKNGWTLHNPGNMWVVNCLAISDDWVLAVEVRYPPALGDLDHGAQVCANVARQQVGTGSPSIAPSALR